MVFIDNLLKILCGAAGLYASLRFVHMLQLESYQANMYMRWLKKHALRDWLPLVLVFFICLFSDAAASMLVNKYAVFLVAQCAVRGIYAVLVAYVGFIWRRVPAKKPLVFTGRVKRLIVAIAFVILLVNLYPLLLRANVGRQYTAYLVARVAVYVPALFLPLLVAIAHFLCVPIEEGIKRRYFNQAKRILAERDDLIKIGITGSYGKTSSKFVLGSILSEKFDVLITPHSYNTPMGITRVAREMLRPSHEVFVAEMGARYVGDIDELCDLVAPTIGLLSSIGKQHLETFGSLENIANTKFELIANLPADGAAFFNGDNEACVQLSKRNVAVRDRLLYGLHAREQVYMRAVDISVSSQGSRFTLICEDGASIACKTRLLGEHNILNVTGGAAVARYMGLSMEQIAVGIRRLEPVEHRLQLIPGAVTVIDDAFNANPDGAKAAMEVLRAFDGRRIVVTPGMIELGAEEEAQNEAFGEQIAMSADFAILVGKKRSVPIVRGMEKREFPKENIFVVSSLDEATVVLSHLAVNGDVVLFENDLPDNYSE